MRRITRMFRGTCLYAALLAALPVSGLCSPQTTHLIARDQLRLDCDPATGRISLSDRSGAPLLLNATSSVDLSSTSVQIVSPRFSPRVSTTSSTAPLLSGPQLTVSFDDQQKELAPELRVTLLADRPGAVFELRVRNVTTTDVQLHSLTPLSVTTTQEGGCRFNASKLLTNGRIYYDPGKLLDFSTVGTTETDSFWNAAFHEPSSGNTLVAGFLDNRDGEGHIVARRTQGFAFDLSTPSRFHSRLLLQPGATISSGRLLLLLSRDGFSGLETYAGLMGRLHNTHLNPVLNGWSTWSCYYGNFNEEEVVRNAEFIARHLKPYGMEWVQIDDGFQRSFADWEGVPDRFPRGMKGTADKIRALGLKAGLWIAPFAVSTRSPLAQEHPDWLVHRPDGSLQPIVEAHQGQAQYILDATHPGARQWLRDLLRTITESWGYDFIKTDFSEWTLLAAEQYHDRSASTARAYRSGVEAMREGMGPHRHMLDCGPGPVAAGLIDSMRIELDRPIPENPLWIQYAGYYNSTGPAVAKRYYFHKRTWINDADHIRLVGLTIPQSKAAATITALSGGTMIAGDCLYKLDPERLDILKRVFPAWGEAARPLDLFATEAPELFRLPVSLPWEQWTVLGCFNWGESPREKLLGSDVLQTAPGKSSLVYDFWSGRYLGETTGSFLLKQEPTSVHLLAIRPKTGKPQILGTDRHFTQGAIELKDVRWDDAARTLSGVAVGHPGMSWNLAVYCPEGYAPANATGARLSHPEGQPHVVHGALSFDAKELPWQITFR